MKRVFYLLMTLIAWSWPAIFIKMLSVNFDFITQSFYRYVAAAIFLVAVVYIREKKAFFKARKHYKKFILPSFFVVAFQLMWVKGIELTAPAFAALITKLSVIAIVVYSVLFFKDERKAIKSNTFVLAVLLGLIGVYGVVMGRSSDGSFFNLGSILIVVGALLWAAYIVSIKKLVKKTDPFVATAFVYSFSVIWFFVITLLFGDFSRVAHVNVWTIILLFGSGIIGVGIGNMYHYKSIQVIGAAKTSVFLLLTPLFVAIFSYFIFREVLTTLQIISGVALILGALLVIHPKIHTHAETR